MAVQPVQVLSVLKVSGPAKPSTPIPGHGSKLPSNEEHMAFKLKDIVRGTTRVVNLTFLQQDGTAHDLTGGSVFFAATLETSPTDDSNAAIDITPVTSHTSATNGQTQIVLSASDTDVATGTYNCGAQAVLADGTVIEETGKVKILQDYKKATS
jgi:hypothetical protein